MARTDTSLAGGSLQLLWIPYFAPGRIPSSENEFGLGAAFGFEIIRSRLGGRIPPELTVTTRPTERVPYRLRSSQGGGRYSRSVGRWDLTANYFYGWEDIATPYARSFPLPSPRVIVEPRYDRKTVFGGTAATNTGPVVIRLESGWSPRRTSAVAPSTNSFAFEKFGQFSTVAGLDYSARSWLWLSGQYFVITARAPAGRLVFDRTTQFLSVYGRTNFFRDTLRPELFVLAGINRRQAMIRPRLTRTFGDHWTAALGADFFEGETMQFLGAFDTKDRLWIEIKWTQ
ncbi:MAG: hypothetical protein ACR2L2_20765 [Acidobacteriota bacterium]